MRRILVIAAFAVIVLPLVLSAATSQQQEMSQEKRNEEVIRRNLDSLNRGDLKAYVSDFAGESKDFNMPAGITDVREAGRRAIEDIVTTFPDWRMEIVEMVAQGESVVVRCKVSGTHRGVGKLPL